MEADFKQEEAIDIFTSIASTVHIMCIADGIPEPSIKWRQNNNLILIPSNQRSRWAILNSREEPGFRTDVPTNASIISQLTITNIFESDNLTEISCSAFNGVGETVVNKYTIIVDNSGKYININGLEYTCIL